MKREVRVLKGAEIRASEDGKLITGYGAVYGQMSDDLGGFREVILPGAFTRCLGESPDVRCLFNHDSNLILGRTKAGTLRLGEDPHGLSYECDAPETQAGKDVLTSIRRRDIDQCSFAFSVNKQTWREEKGADGSSEVIRELADVDLYDVSPVTYAAYPQTSVSARSLWPDGEPEEIREHLRAAACRSEANRLAAEIIRRMTAPDGVE
jgi:HK97 family phage prohead protease